MIWCRTGLFGMVFLGMSVIATSGISVGTVYANEAVTKEEASKVLAGMKWYTEEYPPFNYRGEDGRLTGIAVDVLTEAFRRVGVKRDVRRFRIAPWNRSYKFVQKKPGTALFSMTYTPERLKVMKIVGPSAPNIIAVIALRDSRIKARTPAELSQLSIGVVRDDIGDQLIRKFAISDESIVKKNSLKQLLYLLGQKRIDAVAYSTSVFSHALKTAGQSYRNYEELMILAKGKMGYAFHRSTNPNVLAYLQKALDEMREDGDIEDIIERYQN